MLTPPGWRRTLIRTFRDSNGGTDISDYISRKPMVLFTTKSMTSLAKAAIDYKYPLILCAVFAVIYVPTLTYPFLWDDAELILQNPQMLELANLPLAIQKGFLQSLTNDNSTIPFFRPASLALLFLERHFFGENVLPYRIVHCSVHLTTTMLLYLLLFRLLSKENTNVSYARQAAFAGAFFFLCLAYSVDAVIFLSNIGDVLVVNLMLSTILLHEISLNRKSKLAYTGALLCLSASFFCKETGVLLIFVPLIFKLLKPSAYKYFRTYALTLGSLPFLIVYFHLRAKAIQTPTGIDLYQTLQNFPTMLVVAIRWALFPHPLSLMEPIQELSHGAWLWIPLVLCSAVTIYFLRRHRLLLVGLILWAIAVTPSIAASFLVNYFSPRYLYLPSVGVALGFAYIYFKSNVRLRYSLLAIPILLGLFALIRADVWKTNASLWMTEVQHHPENSLALINFGLELHASGNHSDAIVFLKQATELSKKEGIPPLEALALEKIGMIQLQVYNDPIEARKMLIESLQVYPRYNTWIILGRLYAERDRNFAKALQAFLEANALKKNQFNILLNIAGALGGLQRFDEAIHYLDKAKSVSSNSSVQRNILVQRRRDILSYQQYLLEEETKK